MKSGNIKTFEQFKIDKRSVEQIDEGLFTNYDKKINNYVKDITSKSFAEIDDLKKTLEDFYKFMKRQGAAYLTKAEKATKELAEFLKNPKESDVPADLDNVIAVVTLQDFKVGKDKKGKWVAGTKVASHGTGGAGAASWS